MIIVFCTFVYCTTSALLFIAGILIFFGWKPEDFEGSQWELKMRELLNQLHRAKNEKMMKVNEISALEKQLSDLRIAFMNALPVSEHSPCRVAIIPNGQIVVHVWVASSSEPNQLHILEPNFLTEDAKARKKFPGEHLGDKNG